MRKTIRSDYRKNRNRTAKKKKSNYSAKFWRRLSNTEPNNQELQLLGMLVWLNMPYKYVGNAGLIINGKSPDFVRSDGKKKLIELFGERWHKKEEEKTRTSFFQKSGYEVLIIWSNDLKYKNRKKLLKKLSDFERSEV